MEKRSVISELYLLSQLPVTGRSLSTPIELACTQDEAGKFVVGDSLIYLYGVGETFEAALADYEAMLLDHYAELQDNAQRLSPRLQRQLHYLNSCLA